MGFSKNLAEIFRFWTFLSGKNQASLKIGVHMWKLWLSFIHFWKWKSPMVMWGTDFPPAWMKMSRKKSALGSLDFIQPAIRPLHLLSVSGVLLDSGICEKFLMRIIDWKFCLWIPLFLHTRGGNMMTYPV
jgi:hypothetical protein